MALTNSSNISTAVDTTSRRLQSNSRRAVLTWLHSMARPITCSGGATLGSSISRARMELRGSKRPRLPWSCVTPRSERNPTRTTLAGLTAVGDQSEIRISRQRRHIPTSPTFMPSDMACTMRSLTTCCKSLASSLSSRLPFTSRTHTLSSKNSSR